MKSQSLPPPFHHVKSFGNIYSNKVCFSINWWDGRVGYGARLRLPSPNTQMLLRLHFLVRVTERGFESHSHHFLLFATLTCPSGPIVRCCGSRTISELFKYFIFWFQLYSRYSNLTSLVVQSLIF